MEIVLRDWERVFVEQVALGVTPFEAAGIVLQQFPHIKTSQQGIADWIKSRYIKQAIAKIHSLEELMLKEQCTISTMGAVIVSVEEEIADITKTDVDVLHTAGYPMLRDILEDPDSSPNQKCMAMERLLKGLATLAPYSGLFVQKKNLYGQEKITTTSQGMSVNLAREMGKAIGLPESAITEAPAVEEPIRIYPTPSTVIHYEQELTTLETTETDLQEKIAGLAQAHIYIIRTAGIKAMEEIISSKETSPRQKFNAYDQSLRAFRALAPYSGLFRQQTQTRSVEAPQAVTLSYDILSQIGIPTAAIAQMQQSSEDTP